MLVPIYSAMLRLGAKQNSFVSREAYFDQLVKLCKAPRRLMSLGLRVFEELEFLTVQEGGAFRVSVNRNAPRRDLNESRQFCMVNSAAKVYRESGRFQK